MNFNNPYWSLHSKLDMLAKWLIVHSAIYYELDDSLVSDKAWDSNAKQYRQLANEAKVVIQIKTRWYYVMHNFDGSTGYHLFGRLTAEDQHAILHLAANLVAMHKLGGEDNDKQ